ncbi:DUF1513 domain-containing protein [Aliisedimentitalea scapharcae]|uniref:DUF1513 domain-containing protein n=1 Tax=Aliisedimentitalea scapharcae TaxID=1524259 RepID=A0ABZ2XUM5_9RHOB
MTSRRAFMIGMMATGLCPVPSWAEAGNPNYLAAARRPDGGFELAGLDAAGNRVFRVRLPDRGHAAAAHPVRPEAVAFARRPGTFAIVLDCRTGREIARLETPGGRHFYGHGSFSTDGRVLFTTENDFEAGQGVISLWDVTKGYGRIGEYPSAGVGPHDICVMSEGDVMVVANGGIETHPDMGRAKLNLPLMRPNLTYLSLDGVVLDQLELAPALHRNSIRHLAVRADGLVGFALQWQGEGGESPPVLAVHHRLGGLALRLFEAPMPEQRRTKGYAGSIAFSEGGDLVGFTSPRGGVLHVFNVTSGALAGAHRIHDVCGLSSAPNGFRYTSGTGDIGRAGAGAKTLTVVATHDCQWDNHLVPVPV